MDAAVVYESMFGNTRIIAEAIADGPRASDPEAQVAVMPVAEAVTSKLTDADLLIVGAPTRFSRVPTPLTRRPFAAGPGVREWLAALPAAAPGRRAAAFDTPAGAPNRLASALMGHVQRAAGGRALRGQVAAVDDHAIEVRRLRKSYGGVEQLHGVSFAVDRGEIFGFLGTNGAGKTTTIEILEGYRARDGGEVSVLGTDPAHAGRDWRNRIGLVLQESELNPVYTVRETVAMFARYFSKPTDLDATITAAGLAGEAGERVGRLSGGEKRRVDVALGLVGDPEVLFLDEPTTGLDPAARRGMWALIEGLRRAGKTVFLTTHYMEEAQRLADRIVILRAGAIAAQGTPEQLSRALGHATKITFLAPPQIGPAQVSAAVGTLVERDGRWLGFRSDQPQRDLTALLCWAAEHGIELTDLQVSPPTLDDVFVQLAAPAGDARDGGS